MVGHEPNIEEATSRTQQAIVHVASDSEQETNDIVVELEADTLHRTVSVTNDYAVFVV